MNTIKRLCRFPVLSVAMLILFFSVEKAFPQKSETALTALKEAGATGHIVFTRKMDGEEENSRELFVMTAGSGEVKRITRNKYWDNYARLSPDKKRIVFESIRVDSDKDGKLTDDDRDIYIMDITGKNPVRLLANNNFKGHPQWSNDSKSVIYVERTGGDTDIFLVQADGRGRKRLTNMENAIDPAWSPDNRHIVFVRYKKQWFTGITDLETELWVMDADGKNPKKIFNSETETEKIGSNHGIWDPAWSPDGKRIAFMRRKKPRINFGIGAWNIFTIDPQGKGLKAVTVGDDLYGYPHWSRDSKWIICWGFNVKKKKPPHLMLIHHDSGKMLALTDKVSFDDEMPDWR